MYYYTFQNKFKKKSRTKASIQQALNKSVLCDFEYELYQFSSHYISS